MRSMTVPIPLGPEEQEELIREIGGILLNKAPESWQELHLTFNSTVGIDNSKFEVVTPDGQSRGLASPSVAMDKMAQLRAAMYQDGKGSWFTAKYVIKYPGSYSVEYDYDTEPDFFP